MANKFWTPQNEKLITSIGIGISGYSILSKAFPSLWQLPAIVTKPIFGEISILTIGGAFCIYAIYMLYSKY